VCWCGTVCVQCVCVFSMCVCVLYGVLCMLCMLCMLCSWNRIMWNNIFSPFVELFLNSTKQEEKLALQKNRTGSIFAKNYHFPLHDSRFVVWTFCVIYFTWNFYSTNVCLFHPSATCTTFSRFWQFTGFVESSRNEIWRLFRRVSNSFKVLQKEFEWIWGNSWFNIQKVSE